MISMRDFFRGVDGNRRISTSSVCDVTSLWQFFELDVTWQLPASHLMDDLYLITMANHQDCVICAEVAHLLFADFRCC